MVFTSAKYFCVYSFDPGFLWSPPLIEVTQWYALRSLVNKLTSMCLLFLYKYVKITVS